MEAQKEINITYETLFEILKREKDLADLQKLDESFFTDFVKYFQEKQQILEKEGSVFSFDEQKKAEKQIENARRIIKDLYDRREKKIMNFALIKSRTKTDIMDMSTFLEPEKLMFEEVVKVLSAYRDTVANNLIVGKDPVIPGISVSESSAGSIGISSGSTATDTHDVSGTVDKKEVASASKDESDPMKLVRFLDAVPKFVGTELEEYGPFEEEDVAHLPTPIAELLINKGKVEEIQG